MRWDRHTRDPRNQPSTSYGTATNHDARGLISHRRQKTRHQDRVPSASDFAANDELFFVRSADAPGTLDSPRLYAGGTGHPSNHQQKGTSTASVIVFAFALSGILLVFLLFYFLAKVCSPANEDDLKDPHSESAGRTLKRPMTTRKLASGVQESPRHVLYPRRIYELQAEEGCYSSLPSMKTPETQDDSIVTLKKSTPPSKRKQFKQLVRKLTTHSMPAPPLENYTPTNSPRFSTCSET